MPTKSKSLKYGLSTDSSSEKAMQPTAAATFADMTSRDYQRLIQGRSDQSQVDSYIEWKTNISLQKILDIQIEKIDKAEAKNFLQAEAHSRAVYHEMVWNARRELVVTMNIATLESLASHYEIAPGSEIVPIHPDAADLDKGLLLSRLKQFFEWQVKYYEIAPEMLHIDVEDAIKAAKNRIKGWQPSDTVILESALHHASCKKPTDRKLLDALKECIAVTCACPELEVKLTRRITDTEVEIKKLGDAEDYDNPNETRVLLTALKQELEKHEGELREILAYRDNFVPGSPIPHIADEATDKWFAGQFTSGAPVGSIVRLAWLLDVFRSFWKEHQSRYLLSEPELQNLHEEFSKKGKRGARKKADSKWQRFTTLFVEYVTKTAPLGDNQKPDETKVLVDAFGKDLIDRQTHGACDKRTVESIKEFLSTLMSNIGRQGHAGTPHAILRLLQDDARRSRNRGQFRTSSFATLDIETVGACLEILRAAKSAAKLE